MKGIFKVLPMSWVTWRRHSLPSVAWNW